MLTNDQAIFVNRSSSYIDVYDSLTSSNGHVGGITVGGNKIGRIHPDEFYTLLKSDTPNVTSYGIIFKTPMETGLEDILRPPPDIVSAPMHGNSIRNRFITTTAMALLWCLLKIS